MLKSLRLARQNNFLSTLLDRADVNGQCGWVVMNNLFNESMQSTYISHPDHSELAGLWDRNRLTETAEAADPAVPTDREVPHRAAIRREMTRSQR